MPVTETLKPVKIKLKEPTKGIIALFEQALERHGLPTEDSSAGAKTSAALGDERQRAGLWARYVTSTRESLTSKAHGAKVRELPAVELEFSPPAEMLRRSYLDFLNKMLLAQGESSKETEQDEITSRFALMRILLYRLVSVALSDKLDANNDGHKLLKVLKYFLRLVADKEVLLDCKRELTSPIGNLVPSIFLDKLTDEHPAWVNLVEQVVEAVSTIHQPRQAITNTLASMKASERVIQHQLLALLGSEQDVSSYAEDWLDTELSRAERQLLSSTQRDAQLAVSGEQRQAAIEQLVVEQLSAVKSKAQGLVAQRYVLLQRNRLIQRVLSQIDLLLDYAGWLAVISGLIDTAGLSQLLQDYNARCEQSLVLKGDDRQLLSHRGNRALTKHQAVGGGILQQQLFQNSIDIHALGDEDLKQRMIKQMGAPVVALVNLQQELGEQCSIVNMSRLDGLRRGVAERVMSSASASASPSAGAAALPAVRVEEIRETPVVPRATQSASPVVGGNEAERRNESDEMREARICLERIRAQVETEFGRKISEYNSSLPETRKKIVIERAIQTAEFLSEFKKEYRKYNRKLTGATRQHSAAQKSEVEGDNRGHGQPGQGAGAGKTTAAVSVAVSDDVVIDIFSDTASSPASVSAQVDTAAPQVSVSAGGAGLFQSSPQAKRQIGCYQFQKYKQPLGQIDENKTLECLAVLPNDRLALGYDGSSLRALLIIPEIIEENTRVRQCIHVRSLRDLAAAKDTYSNYHPSVASMVLVSKTCLASTSGCSIVLLDPRSGKTLGWILDPINNTNFLTFFKANKKKYLVAYYRDIYLFSKGGDIKVTIWDVTDPCKPLLVIKELKSKFTDACANTAHHFSNQSVLPFGGQYFACAAGNEVRVWNLTSLAPIGRLGLNNSRVNYVGTLAGHRSSVIAIAALADGTLVSGDASGVIMFWNIHAPAQTQQTHAALNCNSAVTVIVPLDNTHLLIGTVDGKVCCWDIANPQPLVLVGDNGSPVVSIVETSEGNYVAGYKDGSLYTIQCSRLDMEQSDDAGASAAASVVRANP